MVFNLVRMRVSNAKYKIVKYMTIRFQTKLENELQFNSEHIFCNSTKNLYWIS